jgi:hypothetical protein
MLGTERLLAIALWYCRCSLGLRVTPSVLLEWLQFIGAILGAVVSL